MFFKKVARIIELRKRKSIIFGVLVLMTLVTVLGGIYFAFQAIDFYEEHNTTMYAQSHRVSIHLEERNTCNIPLVPPGRSLLRPGGKIYIEIDKTKGCISDRSDYSSLQELTKADFYAKIKNAKGENVFIGKLKFIIEKNPSNKSARAVAVQEFDSSGPKPFKMLLIIKKKIPKLRGKKQYIYARNIVYSIQELIGDAYSISSILLFFFAINILWHLKKIIKAKVPDNGICNTPINFTY